MSAGETRLGSSIPDGPDGRALREEAAQFPSWRAMHGGADPAAAESQVDGRPPVPGFEVKLTDSGAPVPVRALGFEMVRFAVTAAEV